jgi:hypothetical protein
MQNSGVIVNARAAAKPSGCLSKYDTIEIWLGGEMLGQHRSGAKKDGVEQLFSILLKRTAIIDVKEVDSFSFLKKNNLRSSK